MAFPVEFPDADAPSGASDSDGVKHEARQPAPGLALVDTGEGAPVESGAPPNPPPKSSAKSGKTKPVLKRIK
jgi:hypothetical protein